VFRALSNQPHALSIIIDQKFELNLVDLLWLHTFIYAYLHKHSEFIICETINARLLRYVEATDGF